jgi:hypothetical protein
MFSRNNQPLWVREEVYGAFHEVEPDFADEDSDHSAGIDEMIQEAENKSQAEMESLSSENQRGPRGDPWPQRTTAEGHFQGMGTM